MPVGAFQRLVGVLVPIVGEDGWKPAARRVQEGGGRSPRGPHPAQKQADKDGFTIADLCNVFLTAKKRKMEAGELSSMMFYDYKFATNFLVKQFGRTRLVDDLVAEDFGALRAAMAKKWGPTRLQPTASRRPVRVQVRLRERAHGPAREVRVGVRQTQRQHAPPAQGQATRQDARTEGNSHASGKQLGADEGGDSGGAQLRVRTRRLRTRR